MKLKRVINLPTKTKEALTLEMEVDEPNFLYSVDLMEKRVQEVYEYYEGKLKVPKYSPKVTETPTSTSSSPEGTPFAGISDDAKDFNLFNVEIIRIGDVQSGVSQAGKEWSFQGITLRDVKGEKRDLIAWGAHKNNFASLMVGNKINVILVSKIKIYKGTSQYQVGVNTEIEVL